MPIGRYIYDFGFECRCLNNRFSFLYTIHSTLVEIWPLPEREKEAERERNGFDTNNNNKRIECANGWFVCMKGR